MAINGATRPSRAEIEEMDPYSFLAAMGKKVVRPGGHKSTQQLFDLAALTPRDNVLDVGCGVGTTGIEMVRRFGCRVTLVDKSKFMVDEARANVAAAGLSGEITVEEGDIVDLHYPDASFDVVIVEAVTMFVSRDQAVREVLRVTKPGGRVLDQEFCWRDRPDEHALDVLRQPQMCPGINFDDVRNWRVLFEDAGLREIRTVTGPFQLMSPTQFVADEGVVNTGRILIRALSRPAHARKAAWLTRNIVTIMPKLGYIVLAGVKPATDVAHD
jgi:SAM-dependent methyltransferase